MRFVLVLVGVLLFSGITYAQERPLVQFSGVIYNQDSNIVVPYVTVTNLSDRHKTFAANFQGYFSFVAHEGDTIAFSSIGYRRESIIIPQEVKGKSYAVVMKMKATVVNLPVVSVLPWASMDEFNREFMSVKFADDDLEIAKRNVSKGTLLSLAATLPRDAEEIHDMNYQNNHYNMSMKNMNHKAANPLFSPFAWASFIQQIMKGDESRSQNN